MSASGWPVTLTTRLPDGAAVGVRPLRARDARAWVEVRRRNADWLAPWEGRAPSSAYASWPERHTATVFASMLRSSRREARAGRSMPLTLTLDGALCGGITVSGITRGAFDNGHVGYWVDGRVAGRGVTTYALALVLDHCFRDVGLHRVEANVRPENAASLRVVAKLGFVEEGRHRRYLYIDEAWRDHVSFALLAEDAPRGVLRGLRERSA